MRFERLCKKWIQKQATKIPVPKMRGYTYSTAHGHSGKPNEVKRKAVALYLEGMGFRGIGRILHVHNVSVLNWIRKAANHIRECLQKEIPKQAREISIMEWDELWHFVRKKSQNSGYGWLWIGLGWPSSISWLEPEEKKPERSSGRK
jgi:hypothetical protein